MAFKRFLFVAGASLVLLNTATAASGELTITIREFTPGDESYALFKLTDAEGELAAEDTVNPSTCSNAVKEWQKGFSEFKTTSPADTVFETNKPISKKVSFVTLYNPGDVGNDPPEVTCSVATCKKTGGRREAGTAYGLVCSTKPDAAAKKEQFRGDVWSDITKALTEPQVTITEGKNCLTKLDAAREKAGLSKLEAAEDLYSVASETAASGVSKAVCDTLLSGSKFHPLEDGATLSKTFALFNLSKEGEGTPAAKTQTTPTEAQCSAAVEEFQKGFEEFENDPPVDKKVDYKTATSKQVSFVTLYNPDTKAKGQCSVATCKSPTITSDGVEVEPKTVTGLVCSTSPQAFEKESLFTKDQWNNIKSVLSNSASTTVPSILAVAALVAVALSP
ncbi:hypothetical protein Emed_002080 [Eimeria media]